MAQRVTRMTRRVAQTSYRVARMVHRVEQMVGRVEPAVYRVAHMTHEAPRPVCEGRCADRRCFERDRGSLVRLARSGERIRVGRVRHVSLSRTTDDVWSSSPCVPQVHTRGTRDASPCSHDAMCASTSVRRRSPNGTRYRRRGTEAPGNNVGGRAIGFGCKSNGINCETLASIVVVTAPTVFGTTSLSSTRSALALDLQRGRRARNHE